MSMIDARGLTLLGIALANLSGHGPGQLSLPFDRALELDSAVDSIRDRYGSGALTRGVLVGRDPGPWVPLLPD
jgi:DNA polymerase-4